MTNNNNYVADWKCAAAGAVTAYVSSLLLILNVLPILCGGLAATAVCCFINVVKKKEDPRQLHKFVPKPIKVEKKEDFSVTGNIVSKLPKTEKNS